jgi:hypothetical protein
VVEEVAPGEGGLGDKALPRIEDLERDEAIQRGDPRYILT